MVRPTIGSPYRLIVVIKFGWRNRNTTTIIMWKLEHLGADSLQNRTEFTLSNHYQCYLVTRLWYMSDSALTHRAANQTSAKSTTFHVIPRHSQDITNLAKYATFAAFQFKAWHHRGLKWDWTLQFPFFAEKFILVLRTEVLEFDISL